MAISPQNPEVDKIYTELAGKLEDCAENKIGGCRFCELLPQCERKWNAIAFRATMRYLTEDDRYWFLKWFDTTNISVGV